ncbi:MAG: agmatinase, partial [Planctomycetota bacterium]|nr:agmatinase [Planctomycetota bacterium]
MKWQPFGGDEVRRCDPERAAFVLLPVPYDKTATYRKGTAEGPRAILEASSQVELFDEECRLDPTERGVFTAEPLTTDAMPDVLAEQLEAEVRPLLDRGKIVGCLGGEHSISLGPIRAAARAHPGLGILQIDAHPDLRDKYEGTPFGHGCVMRRALEAQDVACLVGVGWRSVSQEDDIAMGEHRIHAHFAHELWRRPPTEWIDEVIAPLPERVYVTIDVDGLDPSIVPGTGTPEPGGLAWWDTMALLKAVCARRNVVAFDVVEVLPEPPSCVSE